MTSQNYTLDDYAAAKAELEGWNARFANDGSNNPDKYRADINAAKAKVSVIEAALKASGVIARTPDEERDAELDKAFPNARNKEVVEWNGAKYRRRFLPETTSLSGKTVKSWIKFWEKL